MQDDENKTLTQNGPRKRISLIGGSIRLASFLAKTCIINGHMQNIANTEVRSRTLLDLGFCTTIGHIKHFHLNHIITIFLVVC
jgi:hypothetical protein